MEIRFDMIDDVLIPILSGELDHHNSDKIRNDIDHTYMVFKAKHIVLSLDEVSFMDSSGVGLIMGRYNKVREKEGKIALIGCSEYILRILDLAGIHTIAKCYEKLEDALAALNGEEEEEV